MSQRVVALLLVLGIAIAAAACGSDGDDTSPTSPPATPEATGTQTPSTPAAASQTPSTGPPGSDVSQRGENVEKVADTALQELTWADGTTYEETIAALMLRSADRPGAPHGRRVVARWLGDDRWQVTIFIHIEDRSTDPPTVIDLRGELYYDESSETFEPANGRASFAFTGRDPCTGAQPPAELCPLDKEVTP